MANLSPKKLVSPLKQNKVVAYITITDRRKLPKSGLSSRLGEDNRVPPSHFLFTAFFLVRQNFNSVLLTLKLLYFNNIQVQLNKESISLTLLKNRQKKSIRNIMTVLKTQKYAYKIYQ